MDAPLTAPGSQKLAKEVLSQFAESLFELKVKFGDKMLETLSDGKRHDTLAITPDRAVALWFVVWPGSHREVEAARIGEYLGQIAGKVMLLVEAGAPLEAFLEVDVYVIDRRDEVTAATDVDVEVEYSFLPAVMFGGATATYSGWETIMLNPDLLSQAEAHALGKFIA